MHCSLHRTLGAKWRAFLRAEQGQVTIEAAIASAALLLLMAAMVAGLATLGAYLQAIDIAGAAARAQAIGEPFTPPRGTIATHTEGELVRVEAAVPAPFGTMRAQALFPKEVADAADG